MSLGNRPTRLCVKWEFPGTKESDFTVSFTDAPQMLGPKNPVPHGHTPLARSSRYNPVMRFEL
jgi:hypothetical protein